MTSWKKDSPNCVPATKKQSKRIYFYLKKGQFQQFLSTRKWLRTIPTKDLVWLFHTIDTHSDPKPICITCLTSRKIPNSSPLPQSDSLTSFLGVNCEKERRAFLGISKQVRKKLEGTKLSVYLELNISIILLPLLSLIVGVASYLLSCIA